jgi:diaminopimelate epimerase
MRTVEFAKGHGTRNDFVLLVDRDGLLDLTSADVAAMCDRRSGIGADGVLRAVAAERVPEWDGPGGVWFMDYRNADGSIAEMCGNGLRVFLRHLAERGLIDDTAEVQVATRAGLRSGWFLPDGGVSVTMGPVTTGDQATIALPGHAWTATSVNVGNPHAVIRLGSEGELAGLDLGTAPTWTPAGAFPNGVNVEFYVQRTADRIRLRVHERGVGETPSCGTGVVAAAAVACPAGRCLVRVPGGELEVDLTGPEAVLTGPAVLVATGEYRLGRGEAA